MAIINASIKFNGNKAVQAIGDALARHIQEAAVASLPNIKRRAEDAFEYSLKREPTYNQLIHFSLRGELGLRHPEERAQAIIDILKTQINVDLSPFRWYPVGLRGAINFHIAQKSYSEILSSSAAEYISPNVNGGHLIPWLKWLLTAGTEEVVKGYGITFDLTDKTRRYSRSGMALMVKGIGNWGMPAKYAGSPDFNWITKALDTTLGPVHTIIVEELTAHV